MNKILIIACVLGMVGVCGAEDVYQVRNKELKIVDIIKSEIIPLKKLQPSLLFVSYIGWDNDITYHYQWSVVQYNKLIASGEQLKEICEYLAEENGYKGVSIYTWKRLERPPK